MKTSQRKYLTLIADDDQVIRQILMKILADFSDFIEFSNGENVVEAYKKHQPDVVFLDIHMPGINGMDILKEVKAINRNAYVIMVTSDSSKENVKRAIQEGASDFIAKPFDMKTVLEKFHCSPTVQVKRSS